MKNYKPLSHPYNKLAYLLSKYQEASSNPDSVDLVSLKRDIDELVGWIHARNVLDNIKFN